MVEKETRKVKESEEKKCKEVQYTGNRKDAGGPFVIH